MSRPLRIELEGGFHHVVSHGNGRLWLFRNDQQRKYFLNLLGAAAFKYKITVHAFALMTNHIHLLVETPLPNLNQFMRKLLSDYALCYNMWNQRRGSVFKSRYGSFLIQQDEYYRSVVQYIYSNPVRAKIVARPEKYRWSSLYYLLDEESARRDVSWYRANEMLELIGGKEVLFDLIGSGDVKLPLVYGNFIGDKDWVDEIVSKNYGRLTDEISNEKEMKCGIVDPQKVIGAVAEVFGLNDKELLAGGSKEAKICCLYIFLKNTPLDARKVGALFKISKWAVLKAVQRFERREKSKKDLEVLDLLKRKMSMSNVQT